ncbi:MAG: hypothetical protein DHS20C16_37420 [Phycisphaerae bacterium]|nr:MAG: hypothetical protein DHS20C16_37420 [Phycisphaerae bacterium]
MTIRRVVLAMAFLLVAPVVHAKTMPYDHMHLIATDPDAAVAWYAEHMDGETVEAAGRLRFGSTMVIFFKRDPGFDGSEGSSVDHIGFSFRDLDAKMKSFEDAGIKILAAAKEVPGKFKYAFIEDPWGTKIEVMEDLETLGFHHIHLKGPEPDKMLDWYENAFGGERTKYKGMLDALNYDGVWLLAQGAKEPQAATEGRAIDHLGWGVNDMDADAKTLKDKGVKFTMEPRPFNPEIAIAIAFVEGPGGVRIELVQRP